MNNYKAGDIVKLTLPKGQHWLSVHNGDTITLGDPPIMSVARNIHLKTIHINNPASLTLLSDICLQFILFYNNEKEILGWIPEAWVEPMNPKTPSGACVCNIMRTGCVCGVFKEEMEGWR